MSAAPLAPVTMLRTLLRAVVVILCLFVFILSAGAQSPPIRIMPLGDSITDGSSFDSPDGSGGYRLKLYNMLTFIGYNVDYVGLQTINSGLLTEKEHEGHSGWRIDQHDSNIAGVLASVADPDVVLMHIGTNDFGQNFNTATAIDRLDALILKIATLRPYAHIVVTNLMERNEPANSNIQTLFNPFVEARVNAHAAAGRRVTFLDMRSAVPVADMPDALHPSQVGYDKMADAWLPAILAVIGPDGDIDPPQVARARGSTDRTTVTVTFSKPVADTAANMANYSLSGGLTISAATLDATKRIVTLTTTQQALGASYTVTVNNVQDRISPTPNTIAPNTTATFSAAIPRGYLNNVPESAGYTLACSLDVPAIANYLNANPVYSVDNRVGIGQFSRVAYYVELQSATGDLQYLWTSMDAFTNDVNKIAVPVASTGAIFQQGVSNMNVATNVPGITTGNGLSGNIEFWPSNYSAPNGAAVPGASDGVYDFGDTRTPTGTYGSMQVHSTTAGQTLFAFNNWGGSATTGNADLGIGNGPSGNPDWTFANNAGSYTIKTIQVLVQTSGDFTGPTPVSATATFGRTSIKTTFSEPLAAGSVKAENFTLNNGVAVLGASLAPNQRDVILTTTLQPAATPLTLTLNNLRDTSPNSNKVIPNTSIAVAQPTLPAEIVTNVGAAANGYQLVYSIDLPTTGNLNALGSSAYSVNDAGGIEPYSRVAYYLELQKPGNSPEFAWVSMDAFNTSRARIGVPTVASGAFFQRPVTNLEVVSNSPAVTNGSIASGNIEFWPSNYTAAKAATSPANASDAILDFGDSGASAVAGYGSMQVHNSGAGETIFALNHFGTDGVTLELGIGNNPAASPNNTGGQKDWTFTNNATAYTRRVLHVLVLPGQSTPASVTSRVPEAANYQLVQHVAIPAAGTLNNTAATTYLVDNRAELGAFSRVAYLMELKKPADSTTSFVWVSMDAFTTEGLKIGVPTTASGAIFQQNVNNMNVVSNVAGVVNGTGITTGNIEFWPTDYSAPNGANVPGASATAYDFGDTRSAGGSHGSMQVHNYGSTQTLFSITNWGNSGSTTNTFGLGIGSQSVNNPDWTFAANSGTYDVRSLQIYVLPTPLETIAPTITRVTPSTRLKGLIVTFSEPVADSAASPANYTINGGVTVTGATLLAGNRDVVLTTSLQTGGAAYTLTVSGVRDRSANGNLIAPGTTVPFTAYALPAIFAGVPEAANYTLIYQLPIPAAVPVWNVNTIPYTVNEAQFGEQGFDRVAYLMELNGNWVYTSFDAFTNTLAKIGVPTLRSSATAFQQNVTNMNVASNVAGIVTGQGITTGNIEFWGGNYTQANGLNVPGASASAYDFGDTMTAGGHGSMQVHNYGATQTLFAYNNWGSNTTGNSEMGIGNNPNVAQAPDWTSTGNAGSYTTRNLYVLARPAPLVPSGAAPQVYQQPTSRLVNAGASTSFSVSATGPSPLSYQWRRNGQPIDGATNQWLDVSPVGAGNGGTYDVVVTTPGGMTATSLPATLSVNALPTFAGYRFTARRNTPSTVQYSSLLTKAGDVDTDPVVVTGASAASTANGGVTTGASSLTYTPPAGYVGADSFTVALSDGRGGTANGTVQVTVTSLLGDATLDAKIATRADGKVETLFAGTPGQNYVIERTTNLSNPAAWEVIATGIVGDDGLIPVLDPTPPVSKAFYRARPTP
jgi:lysophospholipase L1-like esterase